MGTRTVALLCLTVAVVVGGGSALLLGRHARVAAREAHALRAERSVLIEARSTQLKQMAEAQEELDRTAAALRKAETDLDAAKRANIDLGSKLAGYSEELVRKQSELRQLAETQQRLQEQLHRELADHRVTITRLGNSLSVNLVGNVLFGSGQAGLSAEGTEVLRRVGEVVSQAEGKMIRVVGHTDNRPVSQARRGAYPTNWELSAVRATTVVRFLVEAVGVAPERCEAVGVAEYHPVAENETAEGRASNRRIEILLVAPPPSSEPAAALTEGPDGSATTLTGPASPPPEALSSPAAETRNEPQGPAAAP
jgi:chemotaxis protein MotB